MFRSNRSILLGNIFSIAFFNFAGISVTKELSATTRMVLDNGRTLVIWVVTLAIGWQKFQGLQILGFALLVIGKKTKHKFLFFRIDLGMGTYNGVWLNLYRRYVKGEKSNTEREPIVPIGDEGTNEKRFGGYDTNEKNSVNS